MKNDEDLFDYRPQHDEYGEVQERPEGFLGSLDRTAEGWRLVAVAVAIAVPLAIVTIWIFETYIIVP